MPVDLAALQRRYRPDRLLTPFQQRDAALLVSAAAAAGTRQVLLDTTVYIHEVAGKLPPDAADLLDGALHFHCSLAVAEVVQGLGKYHPNSANFGSAWTHYDRLFGSIPQNRLLTPDSGILAQAGAVAGILARTQNHVKDQGKTLFNDAAILLTAARHGLPVLTANRGDCDLIQQVAGQVAFIYYVPK